MIMPDVVGRSFLFRVIGSFAGVRSHFRDFQSEFVTHIEKEGLMSC